MIYPTNPYHVFVVIQNIGFLHIGDEMEKLIEEIHKVLNQYLQEEIGNKVTQFSVIGLRMTIINAITNHFKESKPNEPNKE